MAEQLASETSNLSVWGTIAYVTLSALGLAATALWQHLKKKVEAERTPLNYEVVGAEIADMRPVRQLVNEVVPKIETVHTQLVLLIEMAETRKESILGLSQDHKELLKGINEVRDILHSLQKQGDIDRAIREDRERRGL